MVSQRLQSTSKSRNLPKPSVPFISLSWELRKARLYGENHSVPQSQCQNASGELGDVGGGGRLRCLHGKVDTTISCMCTCSVGSAQCSGCVVYGPGAMAAI